MNGPWHYREAERLADAYKDAMRDVEKMTDDTPRQAEVKYHEANNARALLTKAQVHVGLAQVAATAEAIVRGPAEPGDREIQHEWSEAIS